MQFVAFSDAHFYNNSSKSYVTESGLSSWFEEQLRIVRSIFEYAEDNNVKLVLFAGDLFEEKNRINVPIYNKVFELFEEMRHKFRIVINTGNHDIFTSNLDSSLKPFSSICDVVSAGVDLTRPDDSPFIRVIPFGQVTPELLSCPKGDNFKVLMLHEIIAGLEIGNHVVESELKPLFLSQWDLVLNGHIHKPQKMNNIINIGSIMQQDFGEAGEQKRFIHFKDGKITSISIDHPKFIIIDGLSGKLNGKLENNTRDFFRIDIDSSELVNPVFNKFNVFPSVVKSKERKIRLRETKSVDEELQEYLEIVDTVMDKLKLLEYGKRFIKED